MFAFIKKYPLSLLWCLFILVLCSVRISDIPAADQVHIKNFDKFVHFMFFFVFCLTVFYERGRQQNHFFSRLQFSLLILCVAALYGGAIELLQKYVFIYRSADWLDFAADTLGAVVAILLAFVVFKEKQIKQI